MFLTPLDVRLVDIQKSRPRWRLLAPLRYQSALMAHTLAVPPGFETDFESVPLALMGLTGPPCPQAGTLHDYLYSTHPYTKDECDAIYREAILACGLDPVWANQRFAAVQFYGDSAWANGPMRSPA